MTVFEVPRDPPPLSLSFESIVVDNPAYTTGSLIAYVDTHRDYATWFAESSMGPIIGDVPMSGGRVLGGIVHAQVASGAKWRLRVEALQARVTKLEATATAREIHMQEETTRALSRERELWKRDRKARATIAKKEQSQLQSELAMFHGYTMVLIGELRAARIHVLHLPHIPG